MSNKSDLRNEMERLKSLVTARKGEYDSFLDPQIENTACLTILRRKLWDELMNSDKLCGNEYGSAGQIKFVTHPGLAKYEKLTKTTSDLYCTLGLTYSATPSKINDAGKESDVYPLAQFGKEIANG